MRPSASRGRGFTLIELIIVIAIAGILLGVGVASIKPRDQVQVDQFLTRVPMIVQKVRYDAVTRNVFTRLSVVGGEFVLAMDTNPLTDVQSFADYDALAAGGPGFEAVTMALSGTTSSIEFEPRGVPRGAGTITLVVASAQNPSYAYQVTISMQGSVSWVRL